MISTAIAADSNSGISAELARELGVHILPMSIAIYNRIYYEGVDLSHEEFFRLLRETNVVPKTSQPSPEELISFWDRLLEEYDSVVYIPMSGGLSKSCETATALAAKYGGRIQVVDNHRISVTQYRSVLDAIALSESGASAVEIKEKLEAEAYESSIYIMVDTLEYLKQGGRITPAAAMIGSVLHLKPVLQIQGDKLDSYAKTRGETAARHAMLSAIRDDVEGRFSDYAASGELVYNYSWSFSEDQGRIDSWKEQICSEFSLDDIEGMPLTLSVCTHIGPGALAVTVSHVLTR